MSAQYKLCKFKFDFAWNAMYSFDELQYLVKDVLANHDCEFVELKIFDLGSGHGYDNFGMIMDDEEVSNCTFLFSADRYTNSLIGTIIDSLYQSLEWAGCTILEDIDVELVS